MLFKSFLFDCAGQSFIVSLVNKKIICHQVGVNKDYLLEDMILFPEDKRKEIENIVKKINKEN